MGKKARIKGFRPGKTPRHILETYYREDAEGEAVSNLVTSGLPGRAWQHKNKVTDGFTAKYDHAPLVYFETHEQAEAAMRRERQIINGVVPGRFV